MGVGTFVMKLENLPKIRHMTWGYKSFVIKFENLPKVRQLTQILATFPAKCVLLHGGIGRGRWPRWANFDP